MQVRKTRFEGLLEIIPSVYNDERGWFLEFYKESEFKKHGIDKPFAQENKSFTKRGIVRGLHLQLPPWEQIKLVSVVSGKVLDVVVDLREGSKTFGEVYSCVLSSENHNMLLVPAGFAHGFSTLEDSVFFYKCSKEYNPEYEAGIVWNDPALAINWMLTDPILSSKDQRLPTLEEFLRKSVISQR